MSIIAGLTPAPGITESVAMPDETCPACSVPTLGKGPRYCCARCGTVWVPGRRGFVYDDAYPEQRSHHNDAVARCKQVTLAHWVRRTGVAVAGRRVLEVGFGGGATLDWLQREGAMVAGQEPVAANRDAAQQVGIPADSIAASLHAFEGRQFDLALYLDAFEHLPDPAAHLQMLGRLTVTGSQAMVVLPVADSVSRRMLGRAWPHEIEDHWVFYSTAGLAALWRRFGWRLVQQFYPWKYLSALTIARHWQHKTGTALPLGPLAGTGLWLNFGERGFLFERLPIGTPAP